MQQLQAHLRTRAHQLNVPGQPARSVAKQKCHTNSTFFRSPVLRKAYGLSDSLAANSSLLMLHLFPLFAVLVLVCITPILSAFNRSSPQLLSFLIEDFEKSHNSEGGTAAAVSPKRTGAASRILHQWFRKQPLARVLTLCIAGVLAVTLFISLSRSPELFDLTVQKKSYHLPQPAG